MLVRCGSVTHNFNADQRLVELEFRREGGDVILAQVPSEPNVAIVGYYLAFVIDSSGRPSTGHFVQICKGRRRGPRPWFDLEWWLWLRELFGDGRMPTPEEMRRVRREAIGPTAPPRRRPVSTLGHGPGPGPGNGGDRDDDDGHEHDHAHDLRDKPAKNDTDEHPHRAGRAGGRKKKK